MELSSSSTDAVFNEKNKYKKVLKKMAQKQFNKKPELVTPKIQHVHCEPTKNIPKVEINASLLNNIPLISQAAI